MADSSSAQRVVTSLTNTGSEYDYLSQSAALDQLHEIQALFSKKRNVNKETQAHVNHLLFLIEKALATG